MIGKKIQCILLGIENRIDLVEERSSVFSSKFVLESGPYCRRGFISDEEDEPLRLYGLDEVCCGILVVIDKVIIVVFGVIVNHFIT